MYKKVFLCLLLFLIALQLTAGSSLVSSDSLLKIIQVKDEHARERQLLDYFEFHFKQIPIKDLDSAKTACKRILFKYDIENKWAFTYWIESICQYRLSNKNKAENDFIKAIDFAGKNEDHFLFYIFLNYLAFRQTEAGNATGAISTYRLAKKEAVKMDDNYMQLVADINISDVYYKNNFYSQSLSYLNQAEAINTYPYENDARIKANSQRLEVIIDYNKCENFFRVNKPDSLKKYNEKLKRLKINSRKSFTYKNRTSYYIFLLEHDYKNAITLINEVQRDSLYLFTNLDKQNLADAYFKNGKSDSATQIINQLLADPSEINHPEIKFHQYEVLGEIAEKKNDVRQASINFKLALQQSEDYNNKLSQVGNISSLIKIDEIENAHNQKDDALERERIWLLFILFVALFTVAIIAIIYRNVKQKRHYENLLFTAKKEELSYINSHDVRKHLTNILGLIEVIRHSKNKEAEFLQSEAHLFYSAEELDKAIKNISQKLDD